MEEKILELRSKGHTYNQIQKELNCSKSLISYHCGQGQKEKTKNRNKKNRTWKATLQTKISSFANKKPKEINNRIQKSEFLQLINSKVCQFTSQGKNMNSLTTEQFMREYEGKEIVCYLTGEVIDISKPRTYNFDHKIPVSRGGDNSIDNLGICTKAANQAKHDMTPEEFFEFCKKVINYQESLKNRPGGV